MKMTEEYNLTHKCLELCQTLANHGQNFKFSLILGPSFSFILDSKMKKPAPEVKKKQSSPSSLRRNAKRKQKFLESRKTSSEPPDEQNSTPKKVISCDMCDFEPISKRELENHMRQKHQNIEQLDGHTSFESDDKSAAKNVKGSVKMNHKFKCDQCDHVNTSEDELKIHIGRKHKMIQAQIDSDIYLCDYCDTPLKKNTRTSIYNQQIENWAYTCNQNCVENYKEVWNFSSY